MIIRLIIAVTFGTFVGIALPTAFGVFGIVLCAPIGWLIGAGVDKTAETLGYD